MARGWHGTTGEGSMRGRIKGCLARIRR
jgi:hypothetical protein